MNCKRIMLVISVIMLSQSVRAAWLGPLRAGASLLAKHSKSAVEATKAVGAKRMESTFASRIAEASGKAKDAAAAQYSKLKGLVIGTGVTATGSEVAGSGLGSVGKQALTGEGVSGASSSVSAKASELMVQAKDGLVTGCSKAADMAKGQFSSLRSKVLPPAGPTTEFVSKEVSGETAKKLGAIGSNNAWIGGTANPTIVEQQVINNNFAKKNWVDLVQSAGQQGILAVGALGGAVGHAVYSKLTTPSANSGVTTPTATAPVIIHQHSTPAPAPAPTSTTSVDGSGSNPFSDFGSGGGAF